MNITIAEQVERLYAVSRKQQELMASLLQGSKIILEYTDFSVCGKMLFEKCRSMVGANCGFISISGQGQGEPSIAVLDHTAAEMGTHLSLGYLFDRFNAQILDSLCSMVDNDPSGTIPEIRNILVVPLIHNLEQVGLLVMGNKLDDFNSEDVAVAEAFAELAALAWFNAKNVEDLKVARLKAEESDRLKSAFLSNMSHEIRTPLNGILGFSELLVDPNLEPAERELYIRIINQNGDQLIALINNILDISLIESGQLVLNFEKVDITALIREVQELFKSPGLQKGNVSFLLDCVCDRDLYLQTDKVRLNQILVNLFGNAAKFTASGHVSIGCRLIHDKEIEELVIFIEDTGIGIAQDKLETIFERFRQADGSTKRHYGGTGLGLAISKGLTELLGGRIEVSSEPGVGSCFRVIFPVRN